jgi:type IV secretory pathway TrbD component
MGMFREIPDDYCAPIRESANRPHLTLGCESEFLVFPIFGSVAVFYSIPTIKGFVLAAVIFALGLSVFRAVAKYDPNWFRVWRDKKNWRQEYWPALHSPPRMANVPLKRSTRARRKLR